MTADEQPHESQDEAYKKALSNRYRAMQQEQQRREIIKRFLTPEAYERLMNVRLSNYELYGQLVNLILTMAQSNRITGKLTEEQLRSVLARLTSKPESKIEFKHK